MRKVVLVTDIDAPLGFEIAKRYTVSDNSLIAASGSEKSIEAFSSLSSENFLQVKWSRKSPISARNVVLSGLNYFRHIDEAVILQTLGNSITKGNNFGDIQFADIESLIDAQVKGNLFLIKELTHYQTEPKDNSKKLHLTVVQYCETGTTDLSPLAALVLKGFDTFIQSLAGSEKNLTVNGFFAASVSVTEYADFIFKTIKEKIDRSNGRIFRFSNRHGIFVKKL